MPETSLLFRQDLSRLITITLQCLLGWCLEIILSQLNQRKKMFIASGKSISADDLSFCRIYFEIISKKNELSCTTAIRAKVFLAHFIKWGGVYEVSMQ